ncbi:MAG: DUF4037 domain-containing protein [Caldilineaceae bacterium]|nr:DUF4037 domain-containing protein [Caldilineaceae bacterium]
MSRLGSLSPPVVALVQSIAAHFALLPQVAAVALAGSLTAGTEDESSDLDIYVYTRADVPLDVRAALVEKRAARNVEIGNDTWGPGDEWVDGETGRGIDLMYFGTIWMEEQLDRVLVQHQPSLGYTTAFWSTLLRSAPLYDRDGWFANLQARAQAPYPEPLRRAIIAKNHPILRAKTSSYLHQLEKAFARQDRVSLNHRVAALLASYFDILFAINRAPHPGEKRLLRYARELCPLQPEGMEAQVDALLCAQAAPWDDDRLLRAANTLIDGLDELLRGEGLL